jgi:pre-mRNA-splicing factor SYF2
LVPFRVQKGVRKANQQAIVAERKRMEPRGESRGVSKQKWLDDR